MAVGRMSEPGSSVRRSRHPRKSSNRGLSNRVHAKGVDKASVLAELARVVARQDVRGDLSERLCAAAVTIAGASGASLTVAYTTPHRVTLCSTDDLSARLEDLQDVLGQGPGPSAYLTGSQVRMDIGPGPDEGFDDRWPEFDEAARAAFTSVQVIAVPIHPDSEVLGVLTYHQPHHLREHLDHTTTQFLADAVGVALLKEADDIAPDSGGPWASRASVHQATGMVIAQLQIGADDALALLRAHAFAHGQPLADVAQSVLRGRLNFALPDEDTDPDTARAPGRSPRKEDHS